jgi:hypothetical protein
MMSIKKGMKTPQGRWIPFQERSIRAESCGKTLARDIKERRILTREERKNDR